MKLPDRPWGRMWLLLHTKRVWVKYIEVDTGHCTSLQYHRQRAELHFNLDTWKVRLVRREDLHSMHHGRYIEIAWGRPDEDDIVRLTDMYGRVNRNDM